MLRSSCCDSSITPMLTCSDCKEPCDSYCTECDREYNYGTETCNFCKGNMKTRDTQNRDLLARLMWEIRKGSRALPKLDIPAKYIAAAQNQGFKFNKGITK